MKRLLPVLAIIALFTAYPGRQRFYRPLVACELWWWEHWRP